MLLSLLPLLLSLLIRSLSRAGSISALETRDLPKIRHKTFSFSHEDSEVKALALRSNNRTKSVLEKLVREPQLGKTAFIFLIIICLQPTGLM